MQYYVRVWRTHFIGGPSRWWCIHTFCWLPMNNLLDSLLPFIERCICYGFRLVLSLSCLYRSSFWTYFFSWLPRIVSMLDLCLLLAAYFLEWWMCVILWQPFLFFWTQTAGILDLIHVTSILIVKFFLAVNDSSALFCTCSVVGVLPSLAVKRDNLFRLYMYE